MLVQSPGVDFAVGRSLGADCFPAEKYRALLEVSRIVSSHENLPELFHDLAGQLHRLLNFCYLSVLLHDPQRDVMRVHTLETSAPRWSRERNSPWMGRFPPGHGSNRKP